MAKRVWVVTGTSSGIGLAIAKYALSQGDKVVATVRSLEKFHFSLRDGGAHPIVLDLADTDEEIQQAAENAIRAYGSVDVLVNNAGCCNAFGPVEEVKLDDVRKQFQANLFGTIAFTQPFVTHFRTRRSGHILNVSSVASQVHYASFSAYCATKAALDAYSDALSKELRPYAVKVHIIAPGYFPTNIFTSDSTYTPINSAEDLHGIPAAAGLSKVYTDASQGYNLLNTLVRTALAQGYSGNVDVLAERVYEVVTDTGMAKEAKVNSKPWLRIPLGSDSGKDTLDGLITRVENYKAVESIWRSTDSKQRVL